jgi:putative transposase
MQAVSHKSKQISVRRQCDLLSISRSSFYYKPMPEKPENLKMMNIMDKHLINRPTEGVMSMVYYLRDLGYPIGPKRIRRLFRIMGRQTLYRKRNLSKLGLREFIKPYLLRNLIVDRPNQVWCTDITYIPMAKGFMYLTAYIDVYSRKIMSWGISNSMDTKWCLNVLQQGIDNYGKPEIVNSDQGSQYTSAMWTQFLEKQEIKISMDGKGRATDNAWIERFWKSIKTDYIYLNPCADGFELYEGVKNHIAYYNAKTHHTTKQKPNVRYEQYYVKKAA